MERALVIRERWLNLILRGVKTWEMRPTPTNVRGLIGLIRGGSGLVVGTARLVDSVPPLTRENYMEYRDKHAIPEGMLDEVLRNRWVVPWVLSEARPLATPVPYRHKSGAVTFVVLEPSVAEAVARQRPNESSDEGSDDGRQGPSVPTSGPVPSPGYKQVSKARPSPAFTAQGSTDEPLFVFRAETAQAYGRPLLGGKFVILAGSTAMRQGAPNVKRDAEDRARLVREGVLVPDTDWMRYRFATDCTFGSASKAAGIIKDGNASGPSLWKHTKTGQTLREYLGSL